MKIEAIKSVNEDHLHIRGENFSVISHKGPPTGSPPHTWRKR